MLALFASILALSVLISLPATASAASIKVVIVVGPVESTTTHYRADANQLAIRAQSYGATVIKIYSPNATWSKVKKAAQGANVLIYLGHGNGSPSPYPYSPLTKNGLGLNRLAGHGNSNVKYYGSWYIKQIKMAPNAVVILNHLCYSAGNSEPGRAKASPSVARQRIDNYASSFLKTGARAVFAEPYGDARYILTGLFTTSMSMRNIFLTHSSAGTVTFKSSKTTGAVAIAKLRVRSVDGFLEVTATQFLGG